MFKTSSRIALTVFSLGLMGAAHAGPETVTITAPAAKPLRGVFQSESDAVIGAYRMSDGRLMVLRKHGSAIMAILDGVPTTRLLAAEGGSFQAADDSMRLRFNKDPQTDDAEVTVSLRADDGKLLALSSAKYKGR